MRSSAELFGPQGWVSQARSGARLCGSSDGSQARWASVSKARRAAWTRSRGSRLDAEWVGRVACGAVAIPARLRFESLSEAHGRALALARETPTLTARSLSERLGGTIALKAESLQRTGSFKL